MKRVLSIFCATALLICALVVPASAASYNIAIASKTVAPGAEVVVPVTVSGDFGDTKFSGAALQFVFDSALTLTKVDVGTAFAAISTTPTVQTALTSPYAMAWAGTGATIAEGTVVTLTFTAPATEGSYNISLNQELNKKGVPSKTYVRTDSDTVKHPLALTEGVITVKGEDKPVVAKTVTYTAANGTVFASLAPVTSFGEGAPVASGTIKTAGTAPEEEVYFYFFPNKGYTVEGMTIDGEPTIGSDISRKFTVTADKKFTFSFAKIADDATPTLAAVTGATTVKEATQFATFGTATGASDFGIIIAKGDTLKDEAGLKAAFEKASETGAIRKYAAEDANADGQFAIEVNGPLFAKGGTYIARMYAANGGNVTFGEIIDIAIAE